MSGINEKKKKKIKKELLFSSSGQPAPLRGRARTVYRYLPPGKKTMLDVGGGDGNIACHLAGKFKNFFVLDRNISSIKIGKERHPDIYFVNGDGQSLPFRDSSFDAVALIEVLEHVPDEKKLIREIHRVLAEDGVFMLTTPHRGLFYFMDPANFRIYLSRFSAPLYKFFCNVRNVQAKKNIPEHKHYRIREIIILLSNYFEIKKIETRGFFLADFLYLLMVKIFRHRNTVTHFIQTAINADLEMRYGTFGSQLFVYAVKRLKGQADQI